MGWNVGPAMDHLGASDDDPVRDEEHAAGLITGSGFRFGPPHLVGVELEWFVEDVADPLRAVPPERVDAAVGDLVLSGDRSVEPGGQLELSSRAASLPTCLHESRSDMDLLRGRLAAAGLRLSGVGLDPHRPPRRFVFTRRNDALEEFFDRSNSAGRWMLRGTASIQISVDTGRDDSSSEGWRRRWDAAHAIGPVLLAAFANSPVQSSRTTGWRSTRQAIWFSMDATRARPVRSDRDPLVAWPEYVLDALVACVRERDKPQWTAPPDLSFREWIRSRIPRVPTVADLRYHLTTLYPPIRPRGSLELRMIDAQQDDDWIVPLAVSSALLNDGRALDAAMSATEPLRAAADQDWWRRAARHGLSDPALGSAAESCFAAARSALADSDGDGDGNGKSDRSIVEFVDAFIERYVERRRCPADDWAPLPSTN